MRIPVILSSAFLAAAAALPAQTASNPAVVLAPPTSANCPVAFAAQHTPGAEIRNVGREAAAHSPSYDLTFIPEAAQKLRKITLTLHGPSGAHTLPAATSSESSTATETVTLTPWIGQDHKFHATLVTDKLTAVQWIELIGLTYADGTTWQASPASSCRVAPNGFMPVSASTH